MFSTSLLDTQNQYLYVHSNSLQESISFHHPLENALQNKHVGIAILQLYIDENNQLGLTYQ